MSQPVSHTATLTIDHPDRNLIRFVAFDTAEEITEMYRDTIVPNSLIVYHDLDQPYTARLTWQTSDPDRARASE